MDCWRANFAAQKQVPEGRTAVARRYLELTAREDANSPSRGCGLRLEPRLERRVRAISRSFYSNFLSMAHRGWMNPTRQLLHSCRLRRCQGAHLSRAVGDVVANRGQTFQNRLPLFPIKLPQERP